MKTHIKLITSAAIAAPLVLLGSAAAHEGEVHPEPAQPAAQTTLQQRLEERKNKLKPRLNAAETKRFQQRCKPAQPALKQAADKVRASLPQRHKAYEAANTQLSKLIGKLDVQGVDTAQLKSQQAELNAKISQYKNDMAAYQQALDDLAAMDCPADAAGFKASLESARGLRQGLDRLSADTRTYITETIKPALVAIRISLASGNQTEGDQ